MLCDSNSVVYYSLVGKEWQNSVGCNDDDDDLGGSMSCPMLRCRLVILKQLPYCEWFFFSKRLSSAIE